MLLCLLVSLDPPEVYLLCEVLVKVMQRLCKMFLISLFFFALAGLALTLCILVVCFHHAAVYNCYVSPLWSSAP